MQRFKRRNLTKRELSRKKEKEKELPLCYECKKLRHFKIDYPTLKKSFKKIKKKAMVAKQSNNEDFNFNEETQNETNFCLMTLDDEVSSKLSLEFTFDEL